MVEKPIDVIHKNEIFQEGLKCQYSCKQLFQTCYIVCSNLQPKINFRNLDLCILRKMCICCFVYGEASNVIHKIKISLQEIRSE